VLVEELGEVRRVGEPHRDADAADRQVGVGEEAFGLQHDPLVDEALRGLAGGGAHRAHQGAAGDGEGVGVGADAVIGGEPLLDGVPEEGEGGVRPAAFGLRGAGREVREAQQERRQLMAQHRRVQAERERGVLVLAAQLRKGGVQRGEPLLVRPQQRRQVVAVQAGRLDGGAREEAGLHGQDGSAVLALLREAVDLARADPEHVSGPGLVLGEIDHVADGTGGEEHHDVEVDAVDAVQRRVRVPGASRAHRADLHAHTADAQVDREGERSDSVRVLAALAAGRALL
jgi:hypothetical protein